MAIVTLSTDFGWKDYYLALIKGGILCKDASVNIVDISHDITSYDIVQAAFIFKNAWRSFPKGSIHILSVNDFELEEDGHFIAIRHQQQFFIGPDNGIFSLIFEKQPEEIFALNLPPKSSFPLKDIFSEAVAHILSKKPFKEIGKPVEKIVQRITFHPVISPTQIRGTVIYIDKYENVITNIQRDLFEQQANDRSFELFYKRNDPITQLSYNYKEVPVGEILCLFNSANYLEIGINMGKAATLLGLKPEDNVQIDFYTP